jgi:hypothetical protein
VSDQSLKSALARFDESAQAVFKAKDAREALRAEDELAIALARVIANLCDNVGVAGDFDSAIAENDESNLEARIRLRLAQLRAERRLIAKDKQEAMRGLTA